jgi:hypothetical protein
MVKIRNGIRVALNQHAQKHGRNDVSDEQQSSEPAILGEQDRWSAA